MPMDPYDLPRVDPFHFGTIRFTMGGYPRVSHWARVLENGRRLSKVTGAKVDVVDLYLSFEFHKLIPWG